MSFPLQVGDRRLPSPPALAAAVREDAAAGGGTVIAAQRPREWVPALVANRLLPRDMAVALVAALAQDAIPSTLIECTHLALALGDPRLGTVLAAAVEAHDVGVLLVPGEDGHSVEDQLLLAAAALAPLDEEGERSQLLERLRHAGLSTAELQVLGRSGTVEEVRTWLPALLQEPLEDGKPMAELLLRDETQDAAVDALRVLPMESRRVVWDLARAADRRIATHPRLRRRVLAAKDPQRAR